MIDTRFHHCTGPMSLSVLLEKAGHKGMEGADRAGISIAGASGLEAGGKDTITFAASAAYRKQLGQTAAGVVIVSPELAPFVSSTSLALVTSDPYGAFIDVLNVLYPNDTLSVAKATASASGPDPRVEDGAVIGRGAIVSSGAEIGAGTVISANAVIGAGVTIGRNCVIGAGVVIECAHVGNDVVIQSGATVGAEGFGFQMGRLGHKKIPQLGRVIIQDRVEIGANTTIDRGTLDDTVIGEGTKIDNLVQIGHNCRIGRNCIISGMVGLSGSTVLEDGVVMGGGSASAGHLTLGAGTIVYARSGISGSFPPGSTIAGLPAQDAKLWKREVAILRRLVKGDRK
jgi:UDP-3-O-[3-hydroxymyristoyl] glucosamine N-acyltransferase